MLGAIAGDIIGSIYEAAPIKIRDFPLFGTGVTFTDDSVCTAAVADWLLRGGDLAPILRSWARRHPGRGYGGMFWMWVIGDEGPYGSWGNGAPMRASPVAWAVDDEALLLERAAQSAAVTHDHPDAVAAAQAVALAGLLARRGQSSERIRRRIESRFGYDLSPSVDDLRPGYRFDVSAKGTAPAALIAALEATGYEDAVRGAISLGGDADTLACITGGVAELMFGLPPEVADEARRRLTPDLLEVVDRFQARFGGT
jgi:ADP-ribosylglycohydrolase